MFSTFMACVYSPLFPLPFSNGNLRMPKPSIFRRGFDGIVLSLAMLRASHDGLFPLAKDFICSRSTFLLLPSLSLSFVHIILCLCECVHLMFGSSTWSYLCLVNLVDT